MRRAGGKPTAARAGGRCVPARSQSATQNACASSARTRAVARASSRRMTAHGAAVPMIYPITPKVGAPPASGGACMRYRRTEEPPGARQRSRHLLVRSQCLRPACGRRRPWECVPAVLRLEQPRLGRAQQPFHLKASQQRLLSRRLLTIDFASDACVWACADGGQADVHAQWAQRSKKGVHTMESRSVSPADRADPALPMFDSSTVACCCCKPARLGLHSMIAATRHARHAPAAVRGPSRSA